MKTKFNLFAAVVLFCAVVLLTSAAFAATTYTVQRGDTLASIARRFNTTYPALAQANNIVNPNLIYVGQTLIIPDGTTVATPVPTVVLSAPTIVASEVPTGGVVTHTVQRGDTIARISRAYGVSISAIIQANALINPNIIYPGQILRIPTGGSVVNVPTTVPTAAATATPPPAATAQPTSVPQPTSTTQPTATAEPTALPTAIPTTAPTATATSEPSQPSGGNLLSNGSFEGGHYNLLGLPELQVPNNWRLEWTEGPNNFGTNDFRPETRVLSGIFLPPHERPLFIFEGWHTFKVFKGYGPINVSLLQDLTLQAGTYEIEATVFPDQVLAYEGGGKIYAHGDAAQVNLFGNGSSTGWMFPVIGQANTFTYRFTVDATQSVTVGVSMLGKYGLINNGFFVDNLVLRVVP